MATRKKSNSNVSQRSSRNGRKDALSVLKGDHKLVQDLLQKLVAGSNRPSKSLESIVSKVEQQVKAHSRIEEEIFYPAFKESVRKKDEQKLYFEAREEHHLVDVVLDGFGQAENNESLAAKCKLLKELVEHHIKEEEREMFPLAKKAMDREQLEDLAELLEQRKQEIMTEMS